MRAILQHGECGLNPVAHDGLLAREQSGEEEPHDLDHSLEHGYAFYLQHRSARRSGSETRAEAQRVALRLFITKGYEATSLREIAEELGVSKAALYYQFASKEDIVRDAITSRGYEVSELLAWVRSQEPSPGLLEQTVLRWVDSVSVEKVQGIRFINANPALVRKVSGASGISDSLGTLATLIASDGADTTRQLLVRMTLLSLNSALMAARGSALSDKEIVVAARESALAILERLRNPSEEYPPSAV